LAAAPPPALCSRDDADCLELRRAMAASQAEAAAEEDAEANVCRICLESDGVLAGQVCACRGSAGSAHLACLAQAAIAEWPRLHRWCWCPTCKQAYVGRARAGLARALWAKVESEPEEDPRRRWAANNLASALDSQGRYAEAARLHRQTWAVCERTLGPGHSDTLASANNLASTLHAQGQYKEAARLHWETLQSRRRTLGVAHADTLRSTCNLAISLYAQGKYSEAAALQRETLGVQRRVLGAEHPETLRSASNFVSTLYAQGKFGEAAALQRETLAVQRRVLGAEHPESLKSASNLASTLHAQGQRVEAAQLHRDTLHVRRRVLGAEHPDTLISTSNLASTLKAQGNHHEAAELHRETLTVQRRVLGDEHPNTLTSMSNFASTLYAQGRYVQAARLQRETLEARRRILGTGHPQTLRSVNNLTTAASMAFASSVAQSVASMALPIFACGSSDGDNCSGAGPEEPWGHWADDLLDVAFNDRVPKERAPGDPPTSEVCGRREIQAFSLAAFNEAAPRERTQEEAEDEGAEREPAVILVFSPRESAGGGEGEAESQWETSRRESVLDADLRFAAATAAATEAFLASEGDELLALPTSFWPELGAPPFPPPDGNEAESGQSLSVAA